MSVDVTPPNRHSSSAFLSGKPTSSALGYPDESMPYLTQQYALPIHRANTVRSATDSGNVAHRAETTLRRKTPNGTLNAGFDVSTDHPFPPLKHQAVPLSNGITPRLDPSHAYNGKRTFLEHQYQQRQNVGLTPWDGQHGTDWQNDPYGQPMNAFPADSVLSQMPAQHYGIHQYYGQTVPSVRQPSFQYLGPTASGGQGSGPYGPYWHDGTFVPYRPAAIRDPRFYHQHVPNFTGQQLLPQLPPPQGSLWAQNIPIPIPQTTSHLGHFAPSFTAIPSVQKPGRPAASNPTLGYALPGDHRYGTTSSARMLEHSYGADLRQQHSSIDLEYGSASPNGQQRERTFSWALQQYRELLAYIHHTRRQQQQSRQAQGQQHVAQRPSFYPKPPQPSPSGSSLQIGKTRTERADVKRDTLRPTSLHRADTAPSSYNQDDHTNRPRSSSLWTSSSYMRDDGSHRRSSHDQSSNPVHGYPSLGEDSRAFRQPIGTSISTMLPPLPVDDSPPVRAATALTQMTALCSRTDWQWIDGMHLGGCLAYGLGHYEKALKWYDKVLERDPKHLEATSNLAATLLALGQRKEAEQNWMKVVKSAPNHFEAVEHLVGLLCHDQRSKDAIKVIEYVERSLRQRRNSDLLKAAEKQSECSSSTASRSPCISELSDKGVHDFDVDGDGHVLDHRDSNEPGFGSSGFAIPGCDNGRILALIHAKGNMLYGLGDNPGAATAFEDAVLIAAGRRFEGIQGLIKNILTVVSPASRLQHTQQRTPTLSTDPVLLSPEQALQTSKLCFPHVGELPGLQHVLGGPQSLARKAVVSTTSNSLLSLAKIFQDGLSNASRAAGLSPLAHGVRDILALYYLSLSLQPSPSTANNVGILLASVQQSAAPVAANHRAEIPGVVPGSGIALALQYYNYGLQLDQNHAHLYTNLGSLLKDIGQLDAAINMYERAVKCDGKFDIALANLANAVKDKGRISDAIVYYKRAVEVNPDFAEAVCGLANALNSVCSWQSRGGIAEDGGRRDRWHVDANGMLLDARQSGATSTGWVKRVVDIVEKQLKEGENWGAGTLSPPVLEDILQQITGSDVASKVDLQELTKRLRKTLDVWTGQKWEGGRLVRLIERATKRISWQRYQDTYVQKRQGPLSNYKRPRLPSALTIPTAPTVLPFHTFTCPMSSKQIRQISQRNALRISTATLKSPWLPSQVFPPPRPPAPCLRVGYVSSDFNNHPLAHLMQSVFGLHDQKRVEAICYATTASDNSPHRQQIQNEAPVFHDASSWSAERLVKQIVQDGCHILVNLNGYTRGARNEVFAARPAPIQMSFMGFAGTLGAEWCDYLLADETSVPPDTLRPWRRNVDLEDQLVDENMGGDDDDWVYGENIIYCRDTFFCCDHKQSAPDANDRRLGWDEEQRRRWQMRKELFPQLSDETIIFGNFNQLYKIDPTTFRTWLRILARVPNSILWLLRFPDLGESHLLATARLWAGSEVASRVIFTDVAPKHLHISRARVCDLVLDTAECNAHTTAADVLWSGTPLLTLPRYAYKMCSRMAASILRGALPKNEEGDQAAVELIAHNEEDYEDKAVALGKSMSYPRESKGFGQGRLVELRKMLFHARWSSGLFDTKRWVRDLEDAYDEAWRRWVAGEGGDIWLDQIPSKA
ncbi:unnamed protein product [Zymoseptoria tritici ST99CH_1A5]|uniref:protein O-GlcNAc transferase n=1 Tax=Zymoseptoria tritici ST99CH_1A5 TaxID=1276529 RepID=A0A1Y6LXG9_ZYMTR|nr:unnamed protein product [Zymoseptoria tritici ST99CH_1A5]